MSRSHDPALHWLHGLNRSSEVPSGRADLNLRLHLHPSLASNRSGATAVAASASELQRKRMLRARELTRLYNNFLRHKVFQIVRDMCSSITDATLPQWSYAFMMDADTAVNRTNLERFIADLDPAVPVYTGLCKRRNTWNQQQRGVGGGPGILLSRSLLTSICPRLEQCAPLRSMMDRLHFAGGDLMLAKCIEYLGHRCTLEKELPWTKPQKHRIRLDEAFRRGPPWVYPPLSGGTILVAMRRSPGARALEMHERFTSRMVPLEQVISFHSVHPTSRAVLCYVHCGCSHGRIQTSQTQSAG